MNHFDTAAAEWDSHPHRVALVRRIGETIRQAGRLTQETHLLDYGCGTGLLGLYLLPHVRHVTGIDTSPGMLDVLREKIAHSRISNMDVALLDLQDPAASLPSPNLFDAVTMNMVLHHVEKTVPLFQNLKSLLAPGGTLFIADLDTEPGTFHGQDASGVFHHGFDRQALNQQLIDAGFNPIEMRTAHTMEKPRDDGSMGSYDIFLAVAES